MRFPSKEVLLTTALLWAPGSPGNAQTTPAQQATKTVRVVPNFAAVTDQMMRSPKPEDWLLHRANYQAWGYHWPELWAPGGRIYIYTVYTVIFEWDERKDRANIAKHGIAFQLAASVFDDPFRLDDLNRVVAGEERRHVIGMAEDTLLVLFVVYTSRSKHGQETIRIISARKASRKERGRYSRLH